MSEGRLIIRTLDSAEDTELLLHKAYAALCQRASVSGIKLPGLGEARTEATPA